MNEDDLIQPRWRIRRTPRGRWEVHLRVASILPAGGTIHVPLGDWPTWEAALGYVERVQTHNYGTKERAA